MSDFNQWFNSGSPPVDNQTNTHAIAEPEAAIPDGWEIDLNARLEKRIAELEAFKKTYDMAILNLGVRIAELEAELERHDKSFRGYVKEVARQMKRADQAETELDALRAAPQGS